MFSRRVRAFVAAWGVLFASWASLPGSAAAQPAGLVAQPAALAASRIRPDADLRSMAPLAGHRPAWARAENDAGAMDTGTTLHLDLLLSRPAEREAPFQQLLLDQQDPASPRFHRWLTPAAIGTEFGPSQPEIAAVGAWLTAGGLHVDEVAPSGIFLRVSGSASDTARAFGTEFRLFRAGGKVRRSIRREPSVPAAFVGVITAIGGLSELPEEPPLRVEHVSQPADQPNFTSQVSGNHYVTPGDFAAIYDLNSILNAGINGTGQKVAIIGRSRINDFDILNYEAAVGLPARLHNTIIPPLGLDPGIAADQGEQTLDVQRVLGTAPGAQADLLVSSNAGGGLLTAVQYNVQTLLDPVMTISYGACEVNAGPASVNLYANLFSQAAAEGISVFVSSGDSGAAGCDPHGGAPPLTAQVLSINYICSSGFATCVGGTEFAENGNAASYWSTTNTTSRVSALGYIPEGVWNDPLAGNGSTVISSGGGGVSLYTAKPSFQTGLGVPADGQRDTPDMSFTGSGHDAYFGCFTSPASTLQNCVSTNGSFPFVGFAGTSASAPSMAGVAALLNQKLGAPQGNLNPLLYRLALTPANGVYHDTTVATSGIANCNLAMPSLCNNSTPSLTAVTGGLPGYLLTPGYDLATGWGSLDVANLLLSAAGGSGAPTSTAIRSGGGTLYGTPPVIFVAEVSPASGSVTPTGTVQLAANGVPLGLPGPITAVRGTATAAVDVISSMLPNGTYQITATYSGDATFNPSTSAPVSLTITAAGTIPTAVVVSATPASIPAGQITVIAAAVSSPGHAPPSGGTLSILQTGANLSPRLLFVATGGPATVSLPSNFSGGSYTLTASYSGDSLYAASTSVPAALSVTATQSSTTLTGPATLTTGQTASFVASVSGLPVLNILATVKFLDNVSGAVLGVATLVKAPGATAGTATLTAPTLFSAGTHSITAIYQGEPSSLSSISPPLVLTVTTPGIALSAASPTLSFGAGAASGNTDVVSVAASGGFSGPVALSCNVTFSGATQGTSLPVCQLSSSTVTLGTGSNGTSVVTLATVSRNLSRGGLQARTAVAGSSLLALCAALPLALRRRRRAVSLLMPVVGLTTLAGLVGCGAGNFMSASNGGVTVPGTTAGAYNVVVSAAGTSGSLNLSASTTIVVNVQ